MNINNILNNQKRSTLKFMLSHPVHIISLGFGIGLIPFMPGTFGAMFGWIIFIVLDHYLKTLELLSFILTAFISGIYMTGFTEKKMKISDPDSVILDEIVSIWIILLFIIPATFKIQFYAFLLFRFFDITKPQPIGYFDHHLKGGGFRIMFDDLLATFMTLLLLTFCRSILN